MKKIVLLALNSKYVHTLLAPYYLKANCGAGEIEIFETNIHFDTEKITAEIKRRGADILGISCYIFNIEKVKEVIAHVRTHLPAIKIVLGGPEVSFDYAEYLPLADHVILGEGEIAFAQLAEALLSGKKPDKVVTGKRIELTEIKSPYTEEYFENARGKIAYFEASRGCPFRCSYCMSGDERLRLFQIKYVLQQLDLFKYREIRVLKFVDRTFNADQELVHAVIGHILKNREAFSFPFHFEIAPELINDAMLALLKDAPAGLIQFEAGIQSFSKKTLRSISRKSDTDLVERNLRALIALGNCHVHTDLIAGLPYEDLTTFLGSLERALSLFPHQLQLGFLKMLKGSPIREQFEKIYSFKKEAPYEVLATPWLSAEDILFLKQVEEGLDKIYNSARYPGTLQYLLQTQGLRGWMDLFAYAGAKGAQGQPASAWLRDVLAYCEQAGFAQEMISDLLRFDYALTNSSRLLPDILKTPYTDAFKKKKNEILKQTPAAFVIPLAFHPFEFRTFSGAAVFDYSRKDPVTGRYGVKIINFA